MRTAFVGLGIACWWVLTPLGWGAESRPLVLEVAPLRGVMGHPSLRGEVGLYPRATLGARVESSDGRSERDGFKDRRRSFGIDGAWYPWGVKVSGPFLGAGLIWEEADIGRQRRRDGVTSQRSTADQSHDLWVNHDAYLAAEQAVGYRIVSGEIMTMSLRLSRDETLHQRSRVERDTIYSLEPDLDSRGRAAVVMRIGLFAGILLK